MLKIKYIVLFFLVLLSACGQKKISEQKLAGAIAEVYLTEMILQKEQIPLESEQAAIFYEQALKKHGITKAQYEATMRFYADKKPRELGAIFENASKHLELILKGIERDSIRSLYVEPQLAEPIDTLTQ